MASNNIEDISNSEATKPSPPKLILKPKGDIVNGMMTIEIENLEELAQPEFCQEFLLCYNIHAPDNESYYNQWHSTEFTIFSISEHNSFSVKVPLFLFSYSLEYNLSIKSFILHDENETNTFELVTTLDSPNYMANIPSILMEPSFAADDHVQYSVRDAGYVMSGTILKVLDDDMVQIQPDDMYHDYSNEIVTIHASEVLRYPIRNCFIVDVTNRTQSEIRCIIRNLSFDDSVRSYYELCNALNELFVDQMFNIDHMREEDESGNPKNFEHMSGLVAVYIHQFLFAAQYKHKIKCMLGDTDLCLEQQWKYFLWRNRQDIRKGYQVDEPQTSRTDRNGMGYTCDICRMEVNWYEFVYHCQCKGAGHDFCVSCVDACCAQYQAMKPFVSQLLSDRLNDHCIEEVVSFCVGKINTFNIETVDTMETDIEMTNSNGNECSDAIADLTHVGGKRAMDVDGLPRKKRRME